MNKLKFLGLAGLLAVPAMAPAQKFARPAIQIDEVQQSGQPSKPVNTEFKPIQNANPDPKSLEVPEDASQKAKALVQQLSSPVFREREVATRDLAKMGRLALPALNEVLKGNSEPEAVQRAEGLLPKAEAEDMRSRVSCFLADGEGKFDHTLPGWDKFKTVAGNDKASRELFAEALKNRLTHQMLLAADKTPEEAANVLNTYLGKLMGNQNFRGGWGGGSIEAPIQPKTADLIVALFLEGQFSDKEVVLSPPQFGWGGGQQFYSVANYIGSSSEIQNTIYSGQSNKYSGPIKKIALQWMDTRETMNGANTAYSWAQNLLRTEPKKQYKYAAKVLAGDTIQNQYYIKQNIITQMVSQNVKEMAPYFAKCFDDASIMWYGQNGQVPAFNIELRDFALAAALQMTDQKPEDYGMTRTNANEKTKNANYNAFYFKDDRPLAERNPNGAVVRPGRGGKVVEEKDPKKEEDPKDPKKEEKLTQDDRRKIAFKKWAEWAKTNIKDDKLIEVKKDDAKKEDTKKEETKKDGLTQEQEAIEAAKKEAAKKEEAIKKEELKKEEPKKEEPKPEVLKK